MKKQRILFVCLGNICRSPAAEAIMQKLVKDADLEDSFEIDSAGTSSYHMGELPDARMIQQGARRGYKLDSLSRQFVVDDFDRFDLIVVMDDNNYHTILALTSDLESQKKTVRMANFFQKIKHDHIPDPYYLGGAGFEQVFDLLEDACQGIMAKLTKE